MKKQSQKSKQKLPLPLPAGHTYREAARELGVSHPHLWLVLKGERTSARLIKEARDLFTKWENQAA